MKIEQELSGNFVISTDGTEGDSMLIIRRGKVTELSEKLGRIVEAKKGRAVGLTYGTKIRPPGRRTE